MRAIGFATAALSASPTEPVPVSSPSGSRSTIAGLVLSLFPGIGLLDQAFEEAGFSVVRGPDLLWGGDICRFRVPPGRFDGIIGGPPCQRFSGLGNVNRARWGDDSVMPDRIPEFARCVNEAQPLWFLMENVPAAPAPDCPGYTLTQRLCDNRWCGGEQRRRRRFTFGCRVPSASFHIPAATFETVDELPTVVSTGQADWKGSAQRSRASIEYMAEAQGIDPRRFDNTPFTTTELRRAIANGVPLPMGRAVASAVCAALGIEPAQVDTHRNGGDSLLAPFMGSAVGVADAPNPDLPPTPTNHPKEHG